MAKLVEPIDRTAYPPGVTVGDHVPFYFAPRSPMLLRVLSGRAQYKGDHTGLVMLGVTVRTLVASEATWCVSDRNDATPVVRFSCDVTAVGTFIDFSLMTQFMWNKTPEDQDRQARRAAEALVLAAVPLTWVSHVVTSTNEGTATARRIMENVGSTRQYAVEPSFLYQDDPRREARP